MRRTIRGVVLGLVAPLLVAGPGTTAVTGPGEPAPASQRYDCNRADGSFKVQGKRVYRHEPSGNVGVYADIKNTTDTWRTKVRGQICFYDARGRVIDNGLTVADRLAVAPGQRISFYVSETAPAGWHHYTLRFVSRKTTLRAVTSKVAVTTGEVAVDPYGFLQVPVSVRNDNTFPIQRVAVYVSLYDAAGRIISIDTTTYNYTDPKTIAPGATGTFTADAFASFEGLERVRVSVEAFRG